MSRYLVACDAGGTMTDAIVVGGRLGRPLPDAQESVDKTLDAIAEWSG